MGDHYETEKAWVENRLIYMMSKFQYSAFKSYEQKYLGQITFRVQSAQSFDIVPAIDMYPAMLSGVNLVGGPRTKAGESVKIQNVGGTNTNIYFTASDYLKDIGDLSSIQVDATQDAVLGIESERLETLKVGDIDGSKVTSKIATLNIGKCPALKKIDARNLSSLKGNVDLSQCPRLQEAYFEGTNISGVTIANGSSIKKLHLPGTITTLKLVGLQYLEDFTCDDFSHIEYL
jgi:hypothetical protein